MSWPGYVLSRFERLSRGSAGYWRARCPTHDDRNPSLSIWVGHKGFLLIRCYAGRPECTLGAILAKVGLTMSDLFPPETRHAYDDRPNRALPEQPRPELVASYPYEDEEGHVLYEVQRFHPKSFAQRRADSTARDGWRPGLGEVRRVLYRLPRIVQSASLNLPVLVLEGEEDVHAAEALGLLATTNAGGSGMGWRDEYSHCLRQRRVVVIADNDCPGWRHAERVAGSLMRFAATSVRLLTLPGVKEGGDLRDFLATVPEADRKRELVKAICAAAEWRLS